MLAVGEYTLSLPLAGETDLAWQNVKEPRQPVRTGRKDDLKRNPTLQGKS